MKTLKRNIQFKRIEGLRYELSPKTSIVYNDNSFYCGASPLYVSRGKALNIARSYRNKGFLSRIYNASYSSQSKERYLVYVRKNSN